MAVLRPAARALVIEYAHTPHDGALWLAVAVAVALGWLASSYD